MVTDVEHGVMIYKLNLLERKVTFSNWLPQKDLISSVIVPNEQDSYGIAYTAFAVSSKPPCVYETTFLEDDMENPYISRIYTFTED